MTSDSERGITKEKRREYNRRSYKKRPYAEWTQKEKDQARERDLRWRQNNPINRLITAARYRAKDKGWDFDIKNSDVLLPKTCPVLGIKIDYQVKGRMRDEAPSLDRIDNNKGYIKGNVCVISWRANRLKGDASIAELEAIVQWMKGQGDD